MTDAETPAPVRFVAEIVGSGGNTAGIAVPDEVMAQVAPGKRIPVVVTIGGYTYRSTLSPYRGRNLISLSAENRAAAAVEAGQSVEVELVHDTAPRVTEVPDDLRSAIDADGAAAGFFGTLTASQQKAYVTWVESAAKAETRARRIEETVAALAAGRKR